MVFGLFRSLLEPAVRLVQVCRNWVNAVDLTGNGGSGALGVQPLHPA